MRLDDVILRRDEIIICTKKGGIELLIPIHPDIINDGVGITDKNLCKKALENALRPYFEDLKKYVDKLNREKNPQSLLMRISYLTKEPKVIEEGDAWKINPPGWKARAEGNMIYTLVLDKAKMVPSSMSTMIDNTKIGFTKTKFREYMVDNNMHNMKGYMAINGYAFSSQGIKTMPQALLLRAWTVEYLNMHLNQIKLSRIYTK
ncbi:MAG: hypothetical protein QW404_01300 [Candidatus Nanoarchaeia archaeon]